MTRPQIIRADTIDLQSQDAPSAKDHTRQPAHPGPLGDGPPAPHQAVALKHAEQDVEFHPRSPRHSQDLSNKELQLLHEDSDSFDSTTATLADQNPHNLQRHGANGEEMETGDEGDDGLDDDMMDKISSSPSIEDGGYHLPLAWPNRFDSLLSLSTDEDAAPPPPRHDTLSSSPFLSPPVHFPLFYPQKELDLNLDLESDSSSDTDPPRDHDVHHSSTFLDDFETENPHRLSTLSEQHVSDFYEDFDSQDSYDGDFDPADFHHLLLPINDPLLDNSFDDASLSSPPASPSASTLSTSSWEDQSRSGDDTEVSFVEDSRFIDSGWGGECLRDTEDIDFDFVYALHTFVATVEGQANATKGDTMVLLDDTNSYWWLVRVVKDGSIGYLPAEHIETPTERLARLNKHRNIDLSQTMLGDNPEKPKNPLKIAMLRRNAKTVQFTAPTYFEASDIDYSTEEEEDDGEYSAQDGNHESQSQEQDKDATEDVTVDPSKGRHDETKSNETHVAVDSPDKDVDQNTLTGERTSEETSEPSDEGSNRSRKGTVRNTDSFFRDDSVETRKINLTPSLLRDDSSGSTIKSVDMKELKPRGSLDSLEKAQLPEKPKEDKRRKEKKGMLSGLFKRKDKKNKGQEDEMEDEKFSEELPRESTQESPSQESQSSKVISPSSSQSLSPQPQPQRQSSKLQKAPPKHSSSTKSLSRVEPASQKIPESTVTRPETPTGVENVRFAPVQPEVIQSNNDMTSRVKSPELSIEELLVAESPKYTKRGLSPVMAVSEPKPEQLKTPKQRMPLDEFDSSPDTEEPSNPLNKAQGLVKTELPTERLSESPVHVEIPDQSRTPQPPPLVVDTSSQEDQAVSPVSPASSPELIEAPRYENDHEATPASTTQSSSNTPTWSDASLRAYLEDDGDIRDLLVVVHDKSDVKPADPDHPLVKNLFKEENQKLGEISDQLDSLLGDWLARKSQGAHDHN